MTIEYVASKSPVKFSSKTSGHRKSAVNSLDAMAEYIDVDGVPRRSESVTRRMIQSGVSISNAAIVSNDELGHTGHGEREKEAEEQRREVAELQATTDRMRQANGQLKEHIKLQKKQQLTDANAYVAERLVLWYDERNLSAQDREVVDVTEQNTALTPSKSNAFIDTEGNLRRRPVPPTESVSPQSSTTTVSPSLDEVVTSVAPDHVTVTVTVG